VYLNGDFLPAEAAKVSVLDRGFLFGDGVYEVIPVYDGRPFRLAQHLDRLERSLEGVQISAPLTRDRWTAVLEGLVAHHGGGDLSVYLQVTRGVARRDHAFPAGIAPTVFAMAGPLPPRPGSAGASVIIARDIRWDRCHIKAITLLPNVLLRQEAAEAGAMEAILVRHGIVTEGAASNVFAVVGGRVVTPPKSAQILPGITRDLVIDLLARAGTPAEERVLSLDELRGAEEIWLTSSTREVVPVLRLDGAVVGTGEAGPVWQGIDQLYQAYKERFREGLVD
jgi:D-alanine transaminase